MASVMGQIEHVVVLMMENRSFDNLAAWVYLDEDPKQFIGPSPPEPYNDGLQPGAFCNSADGTGQVCQTMGTTGASPFNVPTPDPEEDFDDMTFQIFGTSSPAPGQPATMSGFLADYAKTTPTNPANAATIMETYSPEQVSMLTGLARSYAISDAWFASAPCQTWPNRAFVHCGTSNGRVNNFPYDPFDFDVPTIFNVLGSMGVSWGVYNPGIFPSLTRIQLPRLWSLELDGHFYGIHDFYEQCLSGDLPSYCFLEPSFLCDPNDQHPPYDVCLGELYFQTIFSWIVNSPAWKETLFVVTYDEHGGCADHVPTPWGAATPDPASDPGEEGFTFDRFGVRVPTLLISPWIQAGTVFRSATGVPYDHTSILATLRDWLKIPADLMLPSARIAAAPTFAEVLTEPAKRTDKPAVAPTCNPTAAKLPDDAPLNELQRSIVVGATRMLAGRRLADLEVAKLLAKVTTQGQAARHLTAIGAARS